MDQFGWAEEEVPPLTDADAPPEYDDPTADVEPWELTAHERRIYEAGFMVGYALREPEVEQLNHEADRLYRAAFDHRNCACWKGHKTTTRESRA
ncbi:MULTISPECIES: hypothetical protein [unclassified Frondihabitans]|jgi:hypothetical protein|uniref:hypothetical protein n=1 Tax=unclassified Frondihabitans TaxID=2626248 RepID=UPI000F4F6973|nr:MULTISPECIES: hypothetical protein [unclassified Frondihabitans]RPE73736.1 hypothetical protein EDF37_3433 [Frondihabitans sp. PhB153]RPF02127.1 hypothetical protein EDF39_3448 [Frondihabitans sp. PhB161]